MEPTQPHNDTPEPNTASNSQQPIQDTAQPNTPLQQTTMQPEAVAAVVPDPSAIYPAAASSAIHSAPAQDTTANADNVRLLSMAKVPSTQSNKLTLIIVAAVAGFAVLGGVVYATLNKKDTVLPATYDPYRTIDPSALKTVPEPNATSIAPTKSEEQTQIIKLNALHLKLEEFYSENNGYPISLTATLFPKMDPLTLLDRNNVSIQVTAPATTIATAAAFPAPIVTGPHMQYIPISCTGALCQKYVLRLYIAYPNKTTSNPFIKNSLN